MDIKPFAKLVPRLLIVSAIFWIPLLLFVLIADDVRDHGALYGDTAILQWLYSFSNPGLDRLAVAITTLGNAATVIIGVGLAIAGLYYTGRRRQGLFLAFCAIGTVCINLVLKQIFTRDRPSLWQQIITENGYSFPSGHAMISSALAFSLIILAWKTRYRWLVAIAATSYFLLVSVSRAYLGVHYPSDIIAGWCISLLWVASVHWAFAWHGRRNIRD